MKLPCAVVKDLLPLYAEKMTEPETRKLVDEHLEDCAECRQKLAEMGSDNVAPVESTQPLVALKKEIRKRRRYSVIVAALLVFVAVYTFFCHDGQLEPVPWQSGLIEVEGIEARPYEEVYGDAESSDGFEPMVDVLVLKVEGRINGMNESVFKDEDGTRTVILQGWSSRRDSGNLLKDYNEMVLRPVPDRLLYGAGDQQQLLWGEPMNGGVEVLPRLALAFYVIVAAGFALILSIVWIVLRNRAYSWIPRQLFFAPLSYVIAHFLIKGARTETSFMETDFFSIVLTAVALYVLFSFAWQIWSQHKRTV